MQTDVKKELDDLNMLQVKFEVAINQTPEADGIPFPDGASYSFSERGAIQ